MPQSSQAIVPPPTPSALIFLERSILAAGATAEHDQALSSSLRYSCLLFKDEGERGGESSAICSATIINSVANENSRAPSRAPSHPANSVFI